jgi:hypothetical protein
MDKTNAIEIHADALMERLRDRVPALKDIETYAGQVEDRIESMPFRFPAALIAFGGIAEPEQVDGWTYRENLSYTVLVCTSSPRGDHEAGYSVVHDVLRALVNHVPVDGGERWRHLGTTLFFTNRQITAYAVEFGIGVDVQYDQEDA